MLTTTGFWPAGPRQAAPCLASEIGCVQGDRAVDSSNGFEALNQRKLISRPQPHSLVPPGT